MLSPRTDTCRVLLLGLGAEDPLVAATLEAGGSALDVCHLTPYDLPTAIADEDARLLIVGGFDLGQQAIHQVREMGRPLPVIVILTTADSSVQAARLLEEGAKDVILPSDGWRLAARLEREVLRGIGHEVDRVAFSHVQTRFVANLGQELRGPIETIIDLAQQIREDGSARLNQRQLRLTSHIEWQGRQLGDLMGDLIDAANLEAGTLDLNIQEVEVAPLLRRALS